MLHNHTYNGCVHKLEHCTHCDVVYCTKCSREWGNQIRDWPKELPYQKWYGMKKDQDFMLCAHKD